MLCALPNYSISISFSLYFPICMSFCYLFRRASIANAISFHFIYFLYFAICFHLKYVGPILFFVRWLVDSHCSASLIYVPIEFHTHVTRFGVVNVCMQNYQFVIVSILQLKQSDREKKINFKSTHKLWVTTTPELNRENVKYMSTRT